MKISSHISDVYSRLELASSELSSFMGNSLEQKCREHKWLYISRVKDIESFAQKLETGRYSSVNNVDDIFGCTIVVSNISAIKEAEDVIKDFLDIVAKRPPNPNKHPHLPENFSYDSLRLYCKTKQPHTGRIYENMTFEVQIKTFLEHAWSIATHDFHYKTNEISWAKARIVSQLKAMLDNIELTISQSDSLSESNQLKKTHYQYEELNSTIRFYKNYWSDNQLPNDLRRLAENTNQLMYAMNIKLNKLEEILKKDIHDGKGTNTLSLSPFQIVVQSIINQDFKIIESFLRRSKNKQNKQCKYKLLLTNSMDIPDSIDRNHKKIIFVDGSI